MCPILLMAQILALLTVFCLARWLLPSAVGALLAVLELCRMIGAGVFRLAANAVSDRPAASQTDVRVAPFASARRESMATSVPCFGKVGRLRASA